MSFGQRIARLREQKNLTQQQLAQLTNISRSRIALYETGIREPDLSTINHIANFFDVTIDSLLGRDKTLFLAPDGLLPYNFLDSEGNNLQGVFRYSFGVYPLSHRTSQFLYIEETEGNFIKKMLSSSGQYEFLTLIWFLNSHLNLNYCLNAESNGVHRVNLVKEEKDALNPLPLYKEIKSGTGLPVSLDEIFQPYETFIREYLEQSTEAKIDFLKNHL